jgi:hypothetical protein
MVLCPQKWLSQVGKQQNGFWVLNSILTVDEDGNTVTLDDNPYIWVGSLYQGFGIAQGRDAIVIDRPKYNQAYVASAAENSGA